MAGKDRDPLIWVLADDRPGNATQCLGVADALGLPYEVKDVAYRPLAALPNPIVGPSFAGVTRKTRTNLTAPLPDLVIAAGRRTAPVARAIKKHGKGQPFLVQIMDPGPGGRDDFDLIAVPRHDHRRLVLCSVIETVGAPHRITAEKLHQARKDWTGRWGDLPLPWIGLIVGGSTRRRPFTAAMARELGKTAAELASRAGGSLLVTTSRRTGAVADDLVSALGDRPHVVHRWGQGGDNPYLGILGVAEILIVTGDSVSMCSEAAATNAPLYIYAPSALISAKHARFHDTLYALGYARPLGAALEAWTHPPLDVAAEIAAEIRKRLASRAARP